MNGQVVRGVGGRRDEYRPIVSRLTDSADPAAVAYAFGEYFGLSEVYIADLDAIAGNPASLALFSELLEKGLHLWVDAGLRATERLAALGVQTIVAGLESLTGPKELEQLLERWSPGRVVFSLDLTEGKPLGAVNGWNGADAWDIAEHALDLGVRRMLVLDLAAVGANQGLRTEDLCARLRQKAPDLELTTGGGVRGAADLRRLHELGVDKVLVASALHDGRLTREMIARVQAC